MTTLVLNLVLGGWLFASAWVLPQSDATMWISTLTAGAIAGLSLIAFSSPGRPGLRWLLTTAGVWLLASTLVTPHESLGTVFNNLLVSAALALVSIFPPARWLAHWKEEHGGHARPSAG